ncbi:MAG: PorV/PorQ family protein [Luteibaculum sp.]
MRIFLSTIILSVGLSTAFAGNPDRAGSAGADQLLVNPWARTLGLQSSNIASSLGSEAIFTNVAGLALTPKTDILFSTTDYLQGSGIAVAALGFGQRVGESSVIGVSVVSMNFGDIDITTVDRPEEDNGVFSPNMTNIGLSYAKAFSNSIYGGITFRFFSESIANVRGSGMAFDAGIRYITGPKDNIRIGIALKNVGPSYDYSGDGLAIQAIDDAGQQRTFFERTSGAELPALISIGGAYDFHLAEQHMLTANGNFTSNSFTTDEFAIGLQYEFMSRFQLRASYLTERKGQNSDLDRINAGTGIAAGASVKLPINKDGGFISIDYGYKATNPFGGIQSIGLNLSL